MKNSTLQIQQTSEFNRFNVRFNGQGVYGTCVAGVASANVDLVLNDDHFLTGGSLNVYGGSPGDSCNMQVVDTNNINHDVQIYGQPDGVTYGMMPSYPILGQYYTNCQIMSGQQKQITFDISYPAKILAGMALRIIYNNKALALVGVGCNYNLHMALY